MKQTEAIILSMTLKKRRSPEVIKGSRRRRIAEGSGTTVQMVNQVLAQYEQMKTMMKGIGKMSAGGKGFKCLRYGRHGWNEEFRRRPERFLQVADPVCLYRG